MVVIGIGIAIIIIIIIVVTPYPFWIAGKHSYCDLPSTGKIQPS